MISPAQLMLYLELAIDEATDAVDDESVYSMHAPRRRIKKDTLDEARREATSLAEAYPLLSP